MKAIVWILLLALGNYTAPAQAKTMNALGSALMVSPATTVSTSSETELFRDTILANNLSSGKNYSVEAHFNITTPAVSLGTSTIKVYLGSSVVSVISGAALSVGGMSAAPLVLYINIVPRSMNVQILTVDVRQPQGTIISLGTGNSSLRASWAEDASTDKVFKITAQLGGTIGTTTLGTDWIYRSSF